MTSSLPRSPCFTLSGNDVIDAVYYLSAVAKLVSLLFGPLLLQWLFLPRGAGLVDYVVPLSDDLRKTIFVRKVRVDKGGKTSRRQSADHRRRHDDTSGQFARFRQLVKSVPSEQIVDVGYIHTFTFS